LRSVGYNDHGTWFGNGTVDLGVGQIWDAKGSYNKGTKETEFEATNPNADDCASGFTDAFRYEGSAHASKSGGVVTYNGSGTWNSYCSGSIYNSGDWTATDCAQKGGIKNPNGPAKHANAAIVKISPNPVTNSTNISYTVATAGRVNITIYNSMQQAVKVLVNDFRNAGSYSAVWNTRTSNINAGIYRVVAVVNGKTTSTSIQVVR
jgi:hypothetical protein